MTKSNTNLSILAYPSYDCYCVLSANITNDGLSFTSLEETDKNSFDMFSYTDNNIVKFYGNRNELLSFCNACFESNLDYHYVYPMFDINISENDEVIAVLDILNIPKSKLPIWHSVLKSPKFIESSKGMSEESQTALAYRLFKLRCNQLGVSHIPKEKKNATINSIMKKLKNNFGTLYAYYEQLTNNLYSYNDITSINKPLKYSGVIYSDLKYGIIISSYLRVKKPNTVDIIIKDLLNIEGFKKNKFGKGYVKVLDDSMILCAYKKSSTILGIELRFMFPRFTMNNIVNTGLNKKASINESVEYLAKEFSKRFNITEEKFE